MVEYERRRPKGQGHQIFVLLKRKYRYWATHSFSPIFQHCFLLSAGAEGIDERAGGTYLGEKKRKKSAELDMILKF